jgi:ABC-type nickel/cobalt efflux system permease component RcnA
MGLITIKDEVELIAKLIAIFVGLVGVWRAIFEMRQNRRQREVEHHWKQSSQAKSLVDDIKSDYRCSSALQMLDWAVSDHFRPSFPCGATP